MSSGANVCIMTITNCDPVLHVLTAFSLYLEQRGLTLQNVDVGAVVTQAQAQLCGNWEVTLFQKVLKVVCSIIMTITILLFSGIAAHRNCDYI